MFDLKSRPLSTCKKYILNMQPSQPDRRKNNQGRPSGVVRQKRDMSITGSSPVQASQKVLITYLYGIGLPKGLVFDQKPREELRNEAQSLAKKKNNTPLITLIDWNDKHSWNKVQQGKKCYQVLQKQLKEQNINEMRFNQLVDFLVQIGSIFCQECTEQFYIICANILIEGSPEAIWNNLCFFNRRFTSKTIKYYITTALSQQEMFGFFQKLWGNLKEILLETCRNPTQWRLHASKENEDDLDLEKIANGL